MNKETENALVDINKAKQSTGEPGKVKIKEWKMMTKREQSSLEFLVAQRNAYIETYEDPSTAASFVKIDDAIYVIEERLRKEKERLEKKNRSSEYGDMSEEEKRVFVCELLDSRYRKGFGRDGTKRMLKVVDIDNKIVSIVDNKQAIQEQIEQTIADLVVKEKKTTLSPYLISELAKYWGYYGEQIPDNLKHMVG